MMAWCCQPTSHYLSQCWPRSMSPYGITRPQWVNSSPPSAAYMCQWIGSALVQIMACRYSAPSHYLDQWCSIVNSFRNKLQWNFNQNAIFFSFTKMHLKISSVKWRPFCPGKDELNIPYLNMILTAPADVIAPTTPGITFSKVSLLLINLIAFCWWDDLTQHV